MNPKHNVHGLRSEKILPVHLERLAMVYVRQSTLQQVLEHQESTRLQYGLVNHAQALGSSCRAPQRLLMKIWANLEPQRPGRTGFQRLVAEVSLNHVGLIVGVEMSRERSFLKGLASTTRRKALCLEP